MRQLNTNDTPPTIAAPSVKSHHSRGTPGTGTITTSTRYSTPIIQEVNNDNEHGGGSVQRDEHSTEFVVPTTGDGSEQYPMQDMNQYRVDDQNHQPQTRQYQTHQPQYRSRREALLHNPASVLTVSAAAALTHIWRPWKRRKSPIRTATAPEVAPKVLPVTVIPPPPRRRTEPQVESPQQPQVGMQSSPYPYQHQAEDDVYNELMRSHLASPPTARMLEGSSNSSSHNSSSLWRGTPPTVLVERQWNTGESGTTPSSRLDSLAEEREGDER